MGIAVSFFSRLVSRPGILTLVITTGGICGLFMAISGLKKQSVDRAEIDEPVMIFGNASADETSLWDVVGVIVGIETFFRGDIATDTGIGTCPDVAVLIFTDSSYVCIGQSFFSLKNLIVKITG